MTKRSFDIILSLMKVKNRLEQLDEPAYEWDFKD